MWRSNYLPVAYLVSSNCTKNYWNLTAIVKIIAGCWVGNKLHVICPTHCVELVGHRLPVDQSLCHHDYRRCIPQPADASLVV